MLVCGVEESFRIFYAYKLKQRLEIILFVLKKIFVTCCDIFVKFIEIFHTHMSHSMRKKIFFVSHEFCISVSYQFRFNLCCQLFRSGRNDLIYEEFCHNNHEIEFIYKSVRSEIEYQTKFREAEIT